MTFGEKCYQFRKERGLSQESLAEQLGTTRQAVSKWENDQGFPETENLLKIADFFHVSVDALLKGESTAQKQEDKAVYVSKEKAEAWILHEKQTIRRLGTGVAFLLCSGIPVVLLKENKLIQTGGVVAFVLIGIVILFKLCIQDRAYPYQAIQQNPLRLEQTYAQELAVRYDAAKKKYLNLMLMLPVVLVLGISVLVTQKQYGYFVPAFLLPLFLLLLSLSLALFLYGSTMKETYELLLYNEEYRNKWTVKWMTKYRNLRNNAAGKKK